LQSVRIHPSGSTRGTVSGSAVLVRLTTPGLSLTAGGVAWVAAGHARNPVLDNPRDLPWTLLRDGLCCWHAGG